MQATTLDNLRRAKGPPTDLASVTSPSPATSSSSNPNNQDTKEPRRRSSDLVSPKHLKKYTTQLLHAKGVCERRLVEMGADPASYGSFAAAGSSSSTGGGSSGRDVVDGDEPGRLPFDAVMNSAFSRRFFSKYLEEENQQDLLSCWSAIQVNVKPEFSLTQNLTPCFLGTS